MLTPITRQSFGGLDLRGDPQEVQGAIDCLNVEVDHPGTVRTRDGFTSVAAVGTLLRQILMPLVKAAANTTVPSYGVYGVVQVAGPTGTLYDALTGVAASGAGAARVPNQTTYALFGTATTDYLYIAGDSGRGATTTRGLVQKWDGTTLANSVGKPFYLATWNNRLVQAGYDTTADPAGGTNGSWSTIFFSDDAAPDTYTANSFAKVYPGDGERITGMCAWRDKLIVTKETHMFVFYGITTDQTGQPIFNRRPVELPYRMPEMLSRAVVAGEDAFYLLTDGGVYASTGGPPQLISGPINRALVGPVPSTWSDYTAVPTLMGLSYAAGRLWVHILTATASRSFIFDPKTGQWSYSTIGTHVLSSSDGSGVYFVGSGTDNQTAGTVYLTSLTATTDAGSAITSRYRTGFMDLGTPEIEKTVREMILDGTGTITLKAAVNDAVALGTGESVALGTSPAVAQGRSRTAGNVRGRNVSVEASATGAWALSRLTANVRGQRAAGEKSA